MRSDGIGLTKLYNAFHDPTVSDRSISELRELHSQLDICMLSAYGWSDIPADHGFNEVDYLPREDCVRFTISEGARIEVLSRLALLNRERFVAQQGSISTQKRVRQSTESDRGNDLFLVKGSRE